jgi:hypothetical protein
MKKLTKCNNVVITSLIVIGTFIVFFYLYVYGSNNEGFINIGGSPNIGDKISEIKSKHNNNNVTNSTNSPPTNGKFHGCGVLTEYGEQACINGVTMENIRCKWNSSPTTYSGSSIQMSTGGECVTI